MSTLRRRDGEDPRLVASAGFTLVELLITLLLFSLLIAGIWSTFSAQKRTAASQDQLVEVNNNLRIGMWGLGIDVMQAGLGRVFTAASGTCRDVGVLEANPYQITFLYDVNDSAMTNAGTPDGASFQWYSASLCSASDCTGTCSTTADSTSVNRHAEIVRWGLDNPAVTGSVAIVRGASTPFTSTFNATNAASAKANINYNDRDTNGVNPNVYDLWKEVTSSAGVQTSDPIAYGIRGLSSGNATPTDENGNPFLMFSYFLDVNNDGVWQCTSGSGPDAIKGDTGGDCALSTAEINVLTNSATSAGALTQAELYQVLRVSVTLRGETQRPDAQFAANNGYRFRMLRTTFKLNNMAFAP